MGEEEKKLEKRDVAVLAHFERDADGVLGEDDALPPNLDGIAIGQIMRDLDDRGMLRWSPALGQWVITKKGREALRATLPEVSMRPRKAPKKHHHQAELTRQIPTADFDKLSPKERDALYSESWRDHQRKKGG